MWFQVFIFIKDLEGLKKFRFFYQIKALTLPYFTKKKHIWLDFRGPMRQKLNKIFIRFSPPSS